MYALNRQEIVDEVLEGIMSLAHSCIHPVLDWAYTDDVKKYDHDVDRARELMEEAGWSMNTDGIFEKDGEPFSFTISQDRGNPTREQIVAIAQDSWNRMGADVDIEYTEWAALMTRYREGDFQAHHNWWIHPPDPDKFAYFSTGGMSNRPRYSNPEVDDLLRRGRAELDQDKRAEIYKEFQQVMAEEVPCLWLYYNQEIRAHNERLQDLPEIGYRDMLLYMHEVWIRD